MYLKIEQFAELFEKVQKSAFRLQLLERYAVESEMAEFNGFLSGQLLPNRDQDAWLETITKNVRAGRVWQNVHVLPQQLTPYLRYLIDWWYVYHARAGADVRFVLFHDAAKVRVLANRDFWLFDDEILVWMHYSESGHFLGPVMATGPAELALARNIRDLSLLNSIDISKLLSIRRAGSLN